MSFKVGDKLKCVNDDFLPWLEKEDVDPCLVCFGRKDKPNFSPMPFEK